jgi:polyphosphate kinase
LAEGIVFLRRSRGTTKARMDSRLFRGGGDAGADADRPRSPPTPFPRVLNKSLNFAIELEGTDAFGRNSGAAIVQAPRALPRVIRCRRTLCGPTTASSSSPRSCTPMSANSVPGMNVLGCYQFRVTRNSDLFVDDEEIKNLRIALQGELPQRHFGDAVRLEVADNCPEVMTEFLLQQFGLDTKDLYRCRARSIWCA